MQIFTARSTDFFGSQADMLNDPITLEKMLAEHLIPQCGLRVVEGIQLLAEAICLENGKALWQRHDGSIIYEKLPYKIQAKLEKKDFDEKGYLALNKVHIYGVGSIKSMFNVQRKSHDPFHCQLPGCWGQGSKMRINALYTSPILAARLAHGKNFDVRCYRDLVHKGIPYVKLERASLKNLENVFQTEESPFRIAWNLAKPAPTTSYLHSYSFYGLITALLVVFSSEYRTFF